MNWAPRNLLSVHVDVPQEQNLSTCAYKMVLAPYSQLGSEKPVLEMVNFLLASRAESGASFSSAIPVGMLLNRTQRQEPALKPSALVLFSSVKMPRSQQVLYPRAHQECRTQSPVSQCLLTRLISSSMRIVVPGMKASWLLTPLSIAEQHLPITAR